MEKDLILTKEDLYQLNLVLTRFVDTSRIDCAIIINKSGRMINQGGRTVTNMTIGTLFSMNDTGASVSRFVRFVMGHDCVSLNAFFDAYKRKEAIDLAGKTDLVIVEALQNDKPTGFQFAKLIEKKALLIFYNGDLDIEVEGSFWLVLPFGLDRFSEKLKELLASSVPEEEDFETVEQRFPVLKEAKEHTWYLK